MVNPRRYLDSALGPVDIVASEEVIRTINWPLSEFPLSSGEGAVATIVVTDEKLPGHVGELLNSTSASRSDLSGRGAFPLRWVAGEPWIAQYDNGPYVVRHEHDFLVAASPKNSAGAWVNRVLRELLIHGSRRHGYRLCHGAVIEIAGKGLLITGPSGAGKTDLALKLALRYGGRVVTVDRGLVNAGARQIVAEALPFGLNISRHTIRDLEALDDEILRDYDSTNGKYYLSTADAVRVLQVALIPRTFIHGVIELVPAAFSQWQRIDESESLRALRESDVSDTDPGYQIDWLGLRAEAEPHPSNFSDIPVGWRFSYSPGEPLPVGLISDVSRSLLSENRPALSRGRDVPSSPERTERDKVL